MKRITTATTAAIFCITAAFSQAHWEIDNTTYRVDTLSHATIGPGMTETQLHMQADSYSNYLFVATIDLSNEYNDMRVISAGDTVNGLANIYLQATSHDTDKMQQIVGINADFGTIGKPENPAAGMLISDGNFYGYGNYATDFSSYFIYSEDKNVQFARTVQISDAKVEFPTGIVHAADFNRARGVNDAIIFTPHWGSTTRTNVWGREIPMKLIGSNKDFFSGKAVTLEATGPWVGDMSGNKSHGNMAIPAGGVVLSGYGTAYNAITAISTGSRVKVTASLLADGSQIHPLQMVGGSPIMLRDGKVDSARVDDANKSLLHLLQPEPRSAVGCSKDGKKIYLVVVDGRRTNAETGISNGIRVKDLGHVMRYLGCYNAMNCDGGGSSQFYVKGLKGMNGCLVRNLPVGGTYLRPVSNGLFAVSKAPKDETIASIEIREKNVKLSTGETYTPVVYGYNQYGVLVNPDVKDFTIKATDALGKVSGNTLTAGSLSQSGTLTATCGTATYTIPVYVNGGTGVSTVIYDEDINAPVEYFTLQGIRISEPAKGQMVIVRQGSKVSKQRF